jgi:hypothetical protein
LLGVEPPRGSPNASSVHLTSTLSRQGPSSSRPNLSGAAVLPGPPRRVSAPSASVSGVGGEEGVLLNRPNTPSRAHTQPL